MEFVLLLLYAQWHYRKGRSFEELMLMGHVVCKELSGAYI